MADILKFDIGRRLMDDMPRVFTTPSGGTLCMVPMDLGGHFVSFDPTGRLLDASVREQDHKNVTALREYQERRLAYVASVAPPDKPDAA